MMLSPRHGIHRCVRLAVSRPAIIPSTTHAPVDPSLDGPALLLRSLRTGSSNIISPDTPHVPLLLPVPAVPPSVLRANSRRMLSTRRAATAGGKIVAQIEPSWSRSAPALCHTSVLLQMSTLKRKIENSLWGGQRCVGRGRRSGRRAREEVEHRVAHEDVHEARAAPGALGQGAVVLVRFEANEEQEYAIQNHRRYPADMAFS